MRQRDEGDRINPGLGEVDPMRSTTIAKNMVAKQGASAIWGLLRRFMRNRGDGIRGVAAIEFAAVGSVLVVMIIGTADFGMGFYRKMQVQNAAQAGAQYAMLHGFNDSSAAKIENAVKSATSFSGIALSASLVPLPRCVSSTGLTLPDSNSKCPDGSTAGTYVAVSA